MTPTEWLRATFPHSIFTLRISRGRITTSWTLSSARGPDRSIDRSAWGDTTREVWSNTYNANENNGYGIKLNEDERFGGESFSMQVPHTYTLEMEMGEYVKWYVDGVHIRTETDAKYVPTEKMSIRLSIWYQSNADPDNAYQWGGSLNVSTLPVYTTYERAEFTFNEDDMRGNCPGTTVQSAERIRQGWFRVGFRVGPWILLLFLTQIFVPPRNTFQRRDRRPARALTLRGARPTMAPSAIVCSTTVATL